MYDPYNNQAPAVTSPASPPEKVLRFDKNYLKTLPGMLKIAEVSCNFLGFICIKVSTAWVSPIFYNLLYWVGIIVTLFLLCMYMFHFVEKFDNLPWLKFDCFYCAVIVVTYIGTSIFAATIGDSAGYAVGFFGLCAILAYGFDGYLKFKAWRRGLPPQ